MLVVSTRTLKILAALTWYIGGVILLIKGRSLLLEADALKPEEIWPWLAAGAGLFFGGLKAKFIYTRSCQRNLDRIDALDQPRVWQFFSPRFFVALTVMISVGVALSRMAHNNYPFLIGVAILDISIGAALLGGSYVFWKQKFLLNSN